MPTIKALINQRLMHDIYRICLFIFLSSANNFFLPTYEIFKLTDFTFSMRSPEVNKVKEDLRRNCEGMQNAVEDPLLKANKAESIKITSCFERPRHPQKPTDNGKRVNVAKTVTLFFTSENFD